MKKNIAILLTFFILFSCNLSPEEDTATDIVIEEEADEEIDEDVWTPEVLHIYVFNQVDEIVNEFEAIDAANYSTLLTAVRLDIEIHNRDFPLDPWHYIGGGT